MSNDYERFLEARGVETPCERCHGLGTRTYGSTATWRGGIGGQMVTTSVCDKCWGSGDAHRPWRSWREIELLVAENARMKAKKAAADKAAFKARGEAFYAAGG